METKRPPNDDSTVGEADLIAVTRLLGELAVFEASLDHKRRYLIDGLGKIIHADGWLWAMGQVDPDLHSPMSMGFLTGGLCDAQIAGLFDSTGDTSPASPFDKPLHNLICEGKHFVRTRQDLVSDDDWYESPNTKTYMLRHNIDHAMYAITPLGENSFSGVGFFRFVGRDGFTRRDRKIAHIVTTEVRWLCGSDTPATHGKKVAELTPRLRTVLPMLLDGYKCNDIADLYCLSPHTIKGYIRDLYRHFKVKSQLQLIQYFRGEI
jgi:DNA-binding CsgD family transcriptional regulator